MLTLVTAFFDLARREQSSRRDAADYLKHGQYILSRAHPMVIFADSEFIPAIKAMRHPTAPTEIIARSLEDLPRYPQRDQVAAARKKNPVHNASAVKDTANYILLTWSKFDLVDEVVRRNPFHTTHVAWIDFGLTHVATTTFAEDAFAHPANPIKLLVNKWVSSAEIADPNYYNLLRGYVGAGYISGSMAAWSQFIPLFRQETKTCLDKERAPSEEQILPVLMRAHPNLFEVYYGDYDGILDNYYRHRSSMRITNYNLDQCLQRGLFKEAQHIVDQVTPTLDGVTASPEERQTWEHLVQRVGNDPIYLLAAKPQEIPGVAGHVTSRSPPVHGQVRGYYLYLEPGETVVGSCPPIPKGQPPVLWVRRRAAGLVMWEPRIYRHDVNLNETKHKSEGRRHDVTIDVNLDESKNAPWLEAWWQGQKFQKAGDWPRALQAYLHESCHPQLLLEVAHEYRQKGQCALTVLFAEAGLRSNQFQDGPEGLRERLIEELSIAAYYVGNLALGRNMSDILLRLPGISEATRQQTRRNYFFYLEPLAGRCEFVPCQCPPLDFAPGVTVGPGCQRRPMNPSIIEWKDHYIVNCRTVNYDKEPHFHLVDAAGAITTRNFLISGDPQFKGRQCEIIDLNPGMNPSVKGLEDIRLFTWDNNLWFSATEWFEAGRAEMVVGRLADPDVTLPTCQVLEKKRLPSPHGQHQKNWLPWVWEGQLTFVYSYNPLTLIRPDGTFIPTSLHLGPLKGSAPPQPFIFDRPGWLMVVHEDMTHPSTGDRVYASRFLWLNTHPLAVRPAPHPRLEAVLSPAFVFQHCGVEFCCGLLVKGETTALAISKRDCEASLMTVPSSRVRDWLRSGTFQH